MQLKERDADVKALQLQLQKHLHHKEVETEGVHAQLLARLHEQVRKEVTLR
jgi:hypothetical protein